MAKLRWLWYWHVTRQRSRFLPWVGRILPDQVKYHAVVAVAVRVEPDSNPSGVTASEMLNYLDREGKVNGR